MTKPDENRSKWRILRHDAGVKRRICQLVHMPLEARLNFDKQSEYCINSLGFCHRRWLKLRLGGRKVVVLRHVTVVARQWWRKRESKC